MKDPWRMVSQQKAGVCPVTWEGLDSSAAQHVVHGLKVDLRHLHELYTHPQTQDIPLLL